MNSSTAARQGAREPGPAAADWSGRPEFGPATPIVARAGAALLVALILSLVAWIAAVGWKLNFGDIADEALHIDFVAFWAAAKLAVAGEAVAAFDPEILVANQGIASPERWETYTWHYPALFHLLVMPLGLLAFTPAYSVFSASALGVYALAVHRWAKGLPGPFALAVAAPPVALVLATGNISLVWAACLLAALAGLAAGRPALAGAMLALLIIKPQLGLLIPVALIAGRHWGALLWGAVATLALVALTIPVFGLEHWVVFFRTMALTAELYAGYGQNAVTMITWYAFSRQLGAGHEAALMVQGLSLVSAAVAVAVVWRRPVPFDLKAAVLCLATLVSTPYAVQYELVLAVVSALFLARAGVGESATGRAWLAALWALPLPGWLVPGLDVADYVAPALTLCVAAAVLTALRRQAVAAPA